MGSLWVENSYIFLKEMVDNISLDYNTYIFYHLLFNNYKWFKWLFLLIFSEFEGAAAELKGWGIPLIKVDGTKEKELADQVRYL